MIRLFLGFLVVLLAFVAGFVVGKLTAARRLQKWINSLDIDVKHLIYGALRDKPLR
jgi:hypothetical protein